MIIHTALKSLIIAGFVLIILNSSSCHPVSYHGGSKDSGSYGRMTMLKNPCVDSLGNNGICMFKWDCISQKGITLSTCVDGFLFGACCALKDVQEKQTDDNYFKLNMHSNQSNATSLLEFVTLSSLRQKTKSSASEDFRVDTSLNLSPDTKEAVSFIQDNFTADSIKIKTNSSSSFVNSDVIRNAYKSESQSTKSNIFKYSFTNASTVKKLLHIQNDAHQDMRIQDDDYESTTELELRGDDEGDFFHNYQTQVQNSDIRKNATEKVNNNTSVRIAQSLSKENQTNNRNESFQQSTFSSTYIECHTTDGNSDQSLQESEENSILLTNSVHSNITKEIYSITSPYDNISLSTLLNDLVSDQIITKNSYEFETKNLDVDKNNGKQTEQNRENFMNELNMKYNLSIENSTKEVDNISTTKEIVPQVWSDYTSLLPSSFQSLIAQLTSREINIPPTVQSNLTTYNFDGKNIKYSAILQNKKQNNSLTTPFHHELKNIQNMHQTQHNINNTISIMDLNSRESSQFMSNFSQTSSVDITSNNSIFPQQTSLNAHNTLLNNTEFNYGDFQELVSETNEILSSAIQTATKSFDDSKLENTMVFQVFCNEENGLKGENCTKYFSDSDKGQYENRFVSSEENFDENNEPLIFYPNTNTDSVTSLNFDSKYNESKVTYGLENTIYKLNGLNDMRDEYDIDNTAQTHTNYSGIDLPLDEISNYSSHDINNNVFTKSQFGSYYFSLSREPIPLTDIHDDNNLLSQSYNENITTTSQNQGLFASFSQNTASLYETSTHLSSIDFANISTEDYASISTEYYDEHALNISAEENTFMTAEINLDKNITQDNFVYSNAEDKFTTFTTAISNNEYTEHYEVLLNTSLNTYAASETSSILKDFETHATYLLNETETNGSFHQSHPESTQTESMEPSTTFNLPPFSSLTSVPPENTSIPTTINILTTQLVNHTITTSANVSVTSLFDNTGLNDSYSNLIITADPNTIGFVNYSTSTLATKVNLISNKNHSINLKLSPNLLETAVKNHVWNYQKDCGVRPMQANGRIVGGRNTYFGQWPWQALVKEATWLGLFVKNKCGGVLITSKYVLTAAHCQPGFLASLMVVLGTHDISNIKENRNPVIHNVKRMVVHRHYNPQTFENDLALLEMDSELEFLPHVVPICLPHRNEDFTGEMAFVTGWGKLTHGGDVPNILQEVQVPIVENRECQMMFYQAGHQKAIQNNFVCAGYINGGQDSCEGDSGGPLMVQRKDKRWVLVGTVSHGIGCADPNLPGVYMRMSSYRPWIDSII